MKSGKSITCRQWKPLPLIRFPGGTVTSDMRQKNISAYQSDGYRQKQRFQNYDYMIYREKREKNGHDGFEVFFGKNEKKLVKTCLFQNKYLSLQRTLVVKDHWQTQGRLSIGCQRIRISLNLKLKSLAKVWRRILFQGNSKSKFRLEYSCAFT